MSRDASRALVLETSANLLLAAGLAALILYFHEFQPVTYVRLIAEDHFGEYATSVSFLLGGLFLIALALRKGPALRRWIWAAGAGLALLIAGEEISWGQRILDISTPAAFREANLQRELNLHNLEAVAGVTTNVHLPLAYLIVAWLMLSAALRVWARSFTERMLAMGVPLMPVALAPLFLLTPFFLLFQNTVKVDEISELMLGLSFVAWTLRLFLRDTPRPPSAAPLLSGATVGVFLAVVMTSAALAHQFPGALGWRLNMTAARDYPKLGKYEQAQALFDYIHAWPEYVRPETRSNHEAMLQLAQRNASRME